MMRRALLGLVLLPATLVAQGTRITGVTSAQYVELRPISIDSAGVVTSGSLVNAAPFLQDLTFVGWGLMQGFSVHVNTRTRAQLAHDGLVYPRSNDRFDLLDAHAELDRGSWRGRLGRQAVVGGLGVHDFDGAALLVRRGTLGVEGWAGRSLAAGLFDPHTTAELAAVETRPPDQDGVVFGTRIRVRPTAASAASFTYQRVLIADRSGLYSERAALDAESRGRGVTADLGLQYDLGSGDWNQARLRVGTGAAVPVRLSGEVRHEQPFFELWTIWGAFAPVGFNEARSTLGWRPRGRPVALSIHGGYRKYAESNATNIDLRTNGWRAGLDMTWTGTGPWSASASYDVDVGFGASRTDGRANLRWNASPDRWLGVDASALQNIYEFRLGTGRVIGGMVTGGWRLRADTQLGFDAGVYRHLLTNGATGPDWTQRRAALRVEWTLGRDPGNDAGRKP